MWTQGDRGPGTRGGAYWATGSGLVGRGEGVGVGEMEGREWRRGGASTGEYRGGGLGVGVGVGW